VPRRRPPDPRRPVAEPVVRPAPRPTAVPAGRPGPRTGIGRGWAALAVVALLATQATLAVHSLVQENPTVDEVIHLPAGLTYWQKGTFRLYHHNPPLVKLLAALPALSAHPKLDYDGAWGWTPEPPNMAAFAHEFMRANAREYFEIFTRARLLMPAFGVVGGLVVFAWSNRLYGPAGGLLSLALWSLCPNILAHTRLVTTDAGATALGALATFGFWRYLRRPGWKLAALAGLGLGLAQLTKFSMLVLFGLWPLLALARFWPEPGRLGVALRTARHGLLALAVCALVIDLGYGFEGVGLPLGDFDFVSQTLTRPIRPGDRPSPPGANDLLNAAHRYRLNRFRGTALGAIPVPLPRHYLLGFDDQKLEAEGMPAKFFAAGPTGPEGEAIQGYPVYLDGTLAQKSWWYYYLLTMAYKVPEGTLALVVGSFVVTAFSPRSRASWPDEFSVLAVPAFVLSVMSVFTNINLGLRYVLPIFPYLFISAGKLAPWASGLPTGWRRRAAWGSVGAGLLATASATASIHPHYLAYFNAVSGGPGRGSDHLIDSNLDWGQDLVGLRRWLKANAPGERVGLAYFGQVNPRVFEARGEAIDWFLPPPAPGSMTLAPGKASMRLLHDPGAMTLEPGLYAVSASLVRGLPWRVYDAPWGAFRQNWGPYQAWFDAFGYFRKLRPVAQVGHSILIYRVSAEDASRLNPIAAGPAPEG